MSFVQTHPSFASPHKVFTQCVSLIEGFVIKTDSVITFGHTFEYGILLYFKLHSIKSCEKKFGIK